jgi:hypothetical protein
VVFVTDATPKGMGRSPQEYRGARARTVWTDATIPFGALHELICDGLRNDRPRLVAEVRGTDSGFRLHFEDGSVQATERGAGPRPRLMPGGRKTVYG